MRSAAKSPPSVTIADAAEMLHARGVTPPMVEEDHHAIQHLVGAGIPSREVPDDLNAVRAALDEHIATGRALIAEARVARRVAAE